MITNQKIQHGLRKAGLNDVSKVLSSKNGILCIMLDWSDGFTHSTDKGQFDLQDNSTIDSFSKEYTFDELVAIGNKELQCVWSNSMSMTMGTNDYTVNGITQTMNDHTDVKIKVGAYGFGHNTSFNEGIDIESEASYNDFNAIKESLEITLTFQTQNLFNGFKLRDALNNIYAFPELFGKKLFVIDAKPTINYDIKDSSKIVSYEITFTHISNKLQKSGKSIEEFIHLSNVGGFYPWPNITILDDGTKQIDLSPNELTITGCKYVKEELYNACVQNNTGFYGWKVGVDAIGGIQNPTQDIDDQGKPTGTYSFKLYQPEPILPVSFSAGEPNPLTKATLPQNTFNHINNVQISATAWTDWKTASENQITQDYDYKYEGIMNYDKSNESINQINELNLQQLSLTDMTFISANGYTDFINDDGTPIKITGSLEWKQLNMYNFFTNYDVLTLPLDFNLEISHLTKSWPYVGGIFNAITGGIPTGWSSSNLSGDNSKKINGIICKPFLDFCEAERKDSSPKGIFLNRFFADSDKDKFNSNNTNTTIVYELTDVFNYDSTKYRSIYTGTGLIPTTDDERTLVSSDNTKITCNANTTEFTDILPDTNATYVICGIKNQNFGAKSFRYTFYNNSYNKDISNNNVSQLWTGTYSTNADWKNYSREWFNLIQFNFFNVATYNDTQTINWPTLPTFNTGSFKIDITTNNTNETILGIKTDPNVGNEYDPTVENDNSWDLNKAQDGHSWSKFLDNTGHEVYNKRKQLTKQYIVSPEGLVSGVDWKDTFLNDTQDAKITVTQNNANVNIYNHYYWWGNYNCYVRDNWSFQKSITVKNSEWVRDDTNDSLTYTNTYDASELNYLSFPSDSRNDSVKIFQWNSTMVGTQNCKIQYAFVIDSITISYNSQTEQYTYTITYSNYIIFDPKLDTSGVTRLGFTMDQGPASYTHWNNGSVSTKIDTITLEKELNKPE